MSELTQLERSLRILQRMMTHDKVSVNELYDLFDRKESKRTLQRTLNDIQSANIPLRISTGKHGEKFYSLDRAFDYVPLALTTDEILASLLLSQFHDYFKGTKLGSDLETVYRKMDQLVPPGAIGLSTTFSDIRESMAVHESGRARVSADTLLEYFDALIRIEDISFIDVRFRNYQR